MLLVPVIFINLSCSQSSHNYGYGHLKLHAITRVSSLAIVITRAEKKWEEGVGLTREGRLYWERDVFERGLIDKKIKSENALRIMENALRPLEKCLHIIMRSFGRPFCLRGMLYHSFAQGKTDFALTRGLRSCQQFSRIGNISHSIASFTPDRHHQRSKIKFVCTYDHVISSIYT